MYATHRTEHSAHRLHTVLLCEYGVGIREPLGGARMWSWRPTPARLFPTARLGAGGLEPGFPPCTWFRMGVIGGGSAVVVIVREGWKVLKVLVAIIVVVCRSLAEPADLHRLRHAGTRCVVKERPRHA